MTVEETLLRQALDHLVKTVSQIYWDAPPKKVEHKEAWEDAIHTLVHTENVEVTPS